MRRRFVTSTCALMVAVAVSAVSGQTPPAQQQPPAQPPAQPPTQAAPPAPSAPKLAFTSPAGLLLVQIKPDQTAAFEELITRLKAGVAKAEDATLKQQMTSWKVYKAAEPMGPEKNTLYVVVADPATANAEYDFFALLQKVMTPEELRAPETAEMFKKFAGAFAAGYNKLNLTPVGGM
jgi:hypothetical protein